MQPYAVSLGAGLRVPAPMLTVPVGLLGILLGKQAIPAGRRRLDAFLEKHP